MQSVKSLAWQKGIRIFFLKIQQVVFPEIC